MARQQHFDQVSLRIEAVEREADWGEAAVVPVR
ncbi:hypothetical protein JOD27_004301 [Lentzea nigeriaca]|nr:hypothetical protein [Lentzea nigeriaca]